MDSKVIKPYEDWSSDELKVNIDVYKILIDMADKVSTRRQSANSFYLSINTAIIGASAYLSLLTPQWINIIVIAATGILICLVWQRNIISYKELNSAKFKVIQEIEAHFIFAPFTSEWKYLDPNSDGTRFKPFHKIEILVPYIFIGVHSIQLLRALPWQTVMKFACELK